MSLHSTLSKLLDAALPNNITVIFVSEREYALADFVVTCIRNKLSNYRQQSFYIDRSFNIDSIGNILQTKSLFNEYNFLYLQFKAKPSLTQQNQLSRLLDNTGINDLILITCNKLTNAEQKFLNNKCTCINISSSDIGFLLTYLFKSHKIDITNDALKTLINYNQENLSQLLQESHNLVLSSQPNTVLGVDDIITLTTNNSYYNIYQLSTNYLSGNLKQSLHILNSIYQRDSILIVWILAEDIKHLLKIKKLLHRGENIRQILQQMNLWGNNINQLPVAAKRLDYATLTDIYLQLANIDMAIKGILSINIKLELSIIIKRICLGTQ